MVELHGWLTVIETYQDEDLFDKNELEKIIKSVSDIVEKCVYPVELQYRNGLPFVNTLYCSNHRTQEVDEIIETYKRICKAATGSYGILYIRDDENPMHYNEFEVYVFKKGECYSKQDTDFSPCIPVIEDMGTEH